MRLMKFRRPAATIDTIVSSILLLLALALVILVVVNLFVVRSSDASGYPSHRQEAMTTQHKPLIVTGMGNKP